MLRPNSYPPKAVLDQLLRQAQQRLQDGVAQKLDCFRVLHHEHPFLRCDKLGKYLAFYWHSSLQPQTADYRFIQDLTHCLELIDWVLYPRLPHGQSPNWTRPELFWDAAEHQLKYEMRGNHGISPGLFLDQRAQRLWLQENARNQKVLNLFSYTGGFTLNAIKGQATEVLSVDASASAHAWARANLELNQLDDSIARFWKDDARAVLTRLRKRHQKYNIVVCDPPSFSRGRGNPFSLKKELSHLIQDCTAVLERHGYLLLSCNLEELSRQQFLQIILDSCPKLTVVNEFSASFDFQSTQPWHLKSVLLLLT